MDEQHAVRNHLDGSEEAEAFLQPTFIGIISELSAITEGVLLPDSAHIEAEAKVCLTMKVHQSKLQSNMLLMQQSGHTSQLAIPYDEFAELCAWHADARIITPYGFFDLLDAVC